MNIINKTILDLAKRQPFNRGYFRRLILNYLRHHTNNPIETTYRGVPFVFNLDNPTEQKALLGFYNNQEIDHLVRLAKSCESTFVDVGANSGFYSQIFLFHAAKNSRVLAIEPNPDMCKRIACNIKLLEKEIQDSHIYFSIENCAVSDREADLYLNLGSGAGAAHVQSNADKNSIQIKSKKLLDLIQSHAFEKIDLLKIDIEGHEDRALIPFFENAKPSLYPRSMIIEHSSDHQWHGDLWGKLRSVGYQERLRTRGNLILDL